MVDEVRAAIRVKTGGVRMRMRVIAVVCRRGSGGRLQGGSVARPSDGRHREERGDEPSRKEAGESVHVRS